MFGRISLRHKYTQVKEKLLQFLFQTNRLQVSHFLHRNLVAQCHQKLFVHFFRLRLSYTLFQSSSLCMTRNNCKISFQGPIYTKQSKKESEIIVKVFFGEF